MRKSLIFFIIILLFVINLSALVTLGYNRWFRGKRLDLPISPEESQLSMKEELSLNNEQMERIFESRSSFETEIDEILVQIQAKRELLMAETKKSTPHMAHIDQYIDEISLLQSEAQKKTVRNLLKDKVILTPNQNTKFFSILEDHVRGRGMGYGRGGKGRGRPRWLRENQTRR